MEEELRFRARMIAAGVWLSVGLLLAVAAWVIATWGTPHRGGVAVMTCGAAIATATIAAIPRDRIVASRYREAFFLTWSLSLILFITVAAGLDAGVRSPIVLMLFLTLVYAALSYPRWAVAVVSIVSLLAVLILSQLPGPGGPPTDPVYLAGLMLTLGVTGVMCVYQAWLQQSARAELVRLSRTDAHTGCLNRFGFGKRLGDELARVQAGGADVTLIMLDLDDFKLVNDQRGHAAGDELLRWAAEAMTAALRPGDILGRLGGDEFVALLPNTRSEHGQHVAERLKLALSPRINACAGVATTPIDGVTIDALQSIADGRLYAAKRRRPPTHNRDPRRVAAT